MPILGAPEFNNNWIVGIYIILMAGIVITSIVSFFRGRRKKV